MSDKKQRMPEPPVPEYEPGPAGDYTEWEDSQRQNEERRWEEDQDHPEDIYDPEEEGLVEK